MNQLYQDLMALCSVEDGPFFFKDFSLNGHIYRIFNYRLASYTDFMKPSALEARGIMFDVTTENCPFLSSRPMRKFFNLNENPMTMNLDYTTATEAMDKADGSLISTYWCEGEMRLKTKGSLFSEQALMAMDYLDKNREYKKEIETMTDYGRTTVNFEFVSPDNRIVLPYQRTELRVLNVIRNETGHIYFLSDFHNLSPFMKANWIQDRKLSVFEAKAFIDAIPEMTEIEGYVIRFSNLVNTQLVKCKTKWYLALHATKDSIIIPRRLFACVVNEATDDLKSMFHNDPVALERIKEMEDMAIPKINHMIAVVDKYYEDNKHLSRKDYAIKGQKELGEYFGLGMNKFIGRPNDYKEFAIKNYKTFGVKDVDEQNPTAD